MSEHIIVHGTYYWESTSDDWEEIPDWLDCVIIPECINTG